MNLLLSLLIFVPKILAGCALAHLLWKDTDLPAMLLKLAIGVPLGLAISAGIFLVAVWVGIPSQVYSWLEFVLVLGITFLFVWRILLVQRKDFRAPTPTWQDLIGISILFVGAALSIGAFLFYARQHPYGF